MNQEEATRLKLLACGCYYASTNSPGADDTAEPIDFSHYAIRSTADKMHSKA